MRVDFWGAEGDTGENMTNSFREFRKKKNTVNIL